MDSTILLNLLLEVTDLNTVFEPAHVLHRREVVLQIFQGQLPCGARVLNGVISVHLHPFFVFTSSEYPG